MLGWWEEGGEEAEGGGQHVDKMPGAKDRGGVESSLRESSGRPSASAFKASLYSGTIMDESLEGCASGALDRDGRCLGGDRVRMHCGMTKKRMKMWEARINPCDKICGTTTNVRAGSKGRL
jgi:hypothetical protein